MLALTQGMMSLAAGGGGGGGGASILAKLGEWWDFATQVSGFDTTRAYAPASLDPGSPIAGGSTPGLDWRSANRSAFTFANGPRGTGDNAISFAGNDRLQLFGGSSALPYAFDNSMSWCVFGWVFWTGTPNGCVFSVWDQSAADRCAILIDITSSQLRLVTGGTTYYNLFTPLPAANTWHFIVAWRDNTNAKTYLQLNDGVIYEFSGTTSGTINFAATATAGAYPVGGGEISGHLSRWGVIRNGLLTPAERTYLYNAGLGRNFSEL